MLLKAHLTWKRTDRAFLCITGHSTCLVSDVTTSYASVYIKIDCGILQVYLCKGITTSAVSSFGKKLTMASNQTKALSLIVRYGKTPMNKDNR